jgi:hypothetical protein
MRFGGPDDPGHRDQRRGNLGNEGGCVEHQETEVFTRAAAVIRLRPRQILACRLIPMAVPAAITMIVRTRGLRGRVLAPQSFRCVHVVVAVIREVDRGSNDSGPSEHTKRKGVQRFESAQKPHEAAATPTKSVFSKLATRGRGKHQLNRYVTPSGLSIETEPTQS